MAPTSDPRAFQSGLARDFLPAVRCRDSFRSRAERHAVVQRGRWNSLARELLAAYTTICVARWASRAPLRVTYEGVEQLEQLHHVEPDLLHAAARALHAGVDFDLPDGAAYAKLPAALAAGLVTQEQIDTAVRRMLRMKFLAGLFEEPYADGKSAQLLTNNAEARALAVQAARKTTVLLKNDGTLPLQAARLKTLAVIGPNAAKVDLGGYSNVPAHTVSILDGIRAKLKDRVKVVSAEGVRITDKGDWYSDAVVLADKDANLARIQEAVKVAQDADEIVLVIGSSSATSREGWDAATHLGDRADFGLIAQQDELARAMFALGKPVVVVLINGAPLSIPEVAAKANALLEGWYPGQEGGTALADILFGDANPGGKLPVTIARSAGQLPMFYNQKPSAHRGYLFDSKEPLFPLRLRAVLHHLRDRRAPSVGGKDQSGSIRNRLGGCAQHGQDRGR